MKTTKLFQHSAFNSLLDFKTKKNTNETLRWASVLHDLWPFF